MARPRTGSLIKRGKIGTYYLRYSLNGKVVQECLHTTIKSEAEIACDKIMYPLRKADEEAVLQQVELRIKNVHDKLEELEEGRTPPTKVKNAWVEFINSHNRPDSGTRTLAGYKSQYTRFLKWVTRYHKEVVEMRQVGTGIAEAYADNLRTENYSASTYNQHLKTLSLIWGVLSRKAKIDHNPWAWDKATKTGIMRRSLTSEKAARKRRALSPDELTQIFKHARGDYHTLFMILLFTGQRLVDAVKMEWQSIDLAKGTISIIPQKTARRTGRQVYIPLLPQLRQELESKIKSGKYILPELVNLYDRDAGSSLSKSMKDIFQAAGIETQIEGGKKSITKVGAHSFRHSFVTIARSAGIPDAMIRTITGHESLEMVDHYTQFTPETVSKLADSLSGQQTTEHKSLQAPDTSTEGNRIKSLLTEMTDENWKNKRSKILHLLEGK